MADVLCHFIKEFFVESLWIKKIPSYKKKPFVKGYKSDEIGIKNLRM